MLVPVGSGYPESITPQETARLTRREHEVLVRESQEGTSAIKGWDDQLDEGNRDPMCPPPSVFESASLGGQRRRGDDDDAEAERKALLSAPPLFLPPFTPPWQGPVPPLSVPPPPPSFSKGGKPDLK